MWELKSDWYSPTHLQSSPNAKYDFPGDRFIPNRSLMDLDQAHSMLTNRTKPLRNPEFTEMYRQKLDKLTLDSEGRPFRMLVFRGSPKSIRRPMPWDDEAEEFDNNIKQYCQLRTMPKKEVKILDAPNLKNDFYMNIMDWGKNNTLAVALGSELFLWNSDSQKAHKLLKVDESDYPTSVAWSEDAKLVAVGYMGSKLQLWDAETCKLVRTLKDHTGRIATTAWRSYSHILTSGSQDKSILNHDVRARNNLTSRINAHSHEVCGLKWSGNKLASGGNDNLLYIWESCKMSSSKFLYRFNEHHGAVKALAWCPYQSDVLASGGGINCGCIKIWSTQKGSCINSTDTKSQICGLEWNRHHKEILSGHGFSPSSTWLSNLLCLWRYPSMTKLGDSKREESRVLHLSQSPDGLTVASAEADETIRFWEVFGPPAAGNSKRSNLDSFLSFKSSPIR
ncbi:hypothetical protein FNV43_RR24323 [Rhamnella rubrinervis]|uniref:CDC20/Fizzy WD40 domain-containing protein n=1 Tax=Rhamnella rubrinervis TaxID=2594499 RepID=A0A8K0DMK1_9ROSA|nr:hypothetical protein FNV43_RR24323 [Rhamnella rubrinervis]